MSEEVNTTTHSLSLFTTISQYYNTHMVDSFSYHLQHIDLHTSYIATKDAGIYQQGIKVYNSTQFQFPSCPFPFIV